MPDTPTLEAIAQFEREIAWLKEEVARLKARLEVIEPLVGKAEVGPSFTTISSGLKRTGS